MVYAGKNGSETRKVAVTSPKKIGDRSGLSPIPDWTVTGDFSIFALWKTLYL
jgi:hypothetical protein